MQDVLDMDLDFHESITEAHMCCLLYRGRSICNAGFQGAHLVSCCSRVTASHFIIPQAIQEKSESSSATPKSKYVQIDSVDGIQKTLRSRWVWTTMNTHEEKWPNMNKNHENGSCHMPGRDTQGSLLRAGLGWTGGWTGGLDWLVGQVGGRRPRGPKLDIRWQWAVNHLPTRMYSSTSSHNYQ